VNLTRIATTWAKAERLARHGFARVSDGIAEALPHVLSPAEMAAASIAIYDGTAGRTTVFDWERTWWAEALPPPPATVLVTGAGAGVEAAALAAMGYTVDAAEPAPALFAKLQERPIRAARLADHRGALAGRYDAVLFGWGSFTCLLDPLEHQACLEAAARVTEGPILLSCWMAETAGAPPNHLLARAGRRLGRVMGKMRGFSSVSEVRFRHWCGFGYVFAAEELAALAYSIGRIVQQARTPYPHITLIKGLTGALSGSVRRRRHAPALPPAGHSATAVTSPADQGPAA
jgi:hypothetical protein